MEPDLNILNKVVELREERDCGGVWREHWHHHASGCRAEFSPSCLRRRWPRARGRLRWELPPACWRRHMAGIPWLEPSPGTDVGATAEASCVVPVPHPSRKASAWEDNHEGRLGHCHVGGDWAAASTGAEQPARMQDGWWRC